MARAGACAPTGAAGGMYYNSAIGQFRCYEVDHWRDCMASARTSFHRTIEMNSTVSDHDFEFNAAGGSGSDYDRIKRHRPLYYGSRSGVKWSESTPQGCA